MNKEYDAIFIHGQGYSQRSGREPVPSIRGRLAASAIRQMLRSGYSFDNYIFSGIPFKGQTLSMSDLNAEAVRRRAGIEESEMVVDQTARTTSMEVGFSRDEAKRNGYKRVLHLTYGEVHQDQIRQHVASNFGQDGIEVDVFRADEVLTDPSNYNQDSIQEMRNLNRYQGFIDCYNQSPTEKRVLSYERKKYKFMGHPFDLGNKALNLVSKFYRPDPSA